jgi:hypothetical protein
MTDEEWESTWKEHASAFDRARAVVMAADEARPAGWIALLSTHALLNQPRVIISRGSLR